MSPIRFAIEKPVTILVGVILLLLFGMLAVLTLPIQLTPDVDLPRITIATLWEGASPKEVERDIIDEQEEKLKAVPGLKKMTSIAVEGLATVEMEFLVGTDVSRALLEVSDRLRQVPDYPENVEQPVVTAGETEGTNAIAWLILRKFDSAPLEDDDLPRMRTLMEEVVQPFLERTPGIAGVGVVGGVEREIHIAVDPWELASKGITLPELRDAIRAQNLDVSAGSTDSGKRSYTVRTIGRFRSLQQIRDLTISRNDDQSILLGDIAEVREAYKEPDTVVRALGKPSIAINATKQVGSNVIVVMKDLQAAIAEVNERVLGPKGMELIQVYDQTLYIYSAIDLVTQNLWVGGLLAVIVLLIFLRSARSTLIIAVAIPISVVGAFLALTLLGRNLNVVSLAGLAFAVGMVVDNSIVVLENIYRHHQMGKSRRVAAFDGTQEVWGAVLASTLTTMAVFIPVVFVEEDAGQLFRDISIAISAAVFLSLIVSVLFIPMAASKLLKEKGASATPRTEGQTGFILNLGKRFAAGVAAFVGFITKSWFSRLATVVTITAGAIYLALAFVPPMSYLPQGNQNLVLGFLIPPPGYNVAEYGRIGEHVERTLAPYWAVREGKELSETLRHPEWYDGEAPMPGITNFFFVARGASVFMGARSDDPTNVAPLAALFQRAAYDLPGTMVFATQRSLFERGLSSSNSIDLEITGDDLGDIQAAAGALFGTIMGKMGPPRPEPANFNLGSPEIQIELDSPKARELGLSVADLGFTVRAMVDGAIVSDFRTGGQTLDVKLVPVVEGTQVRNSLREIPLFTPQGEMVPLSSVVTFNETVAPDEIRHIEERRAIKLVVTPPPAVELSTAMEELQSDIIGPLRAGGAIPQSVTTRLAGTADKLSATRDALKWNLLLALILTYLLLSALFESFLHPLVILFSVPLAGVGGIIGLRMVHNATGQQMDVLTMLGFVILIGTVVNNAILIVHQALSMMREQGMSPGNAVIEAVRTRVRPIFMSTLTSVLGMVPLVLFPGAGSELYRGLGSVVIGGLIASTVFTLLVVPALFRLITRQREPTPTAESPSA